MTMSSLRRRLRFAANLLKFFVAELRRNQHVLAPWTCGEMSLLLLSDTINVVDLFRPEALGSRKLGNCCWIDRAREFPNADRFARNCARLDFCLVLMFNLYSPSHTTGPLLEEFFYSVSVYFITALLSIH